MVNLADFNLRVSSHIAFLGCIHASCVCVCVCMNVRVRVSMLLFVCMYSCMFAYMYVIHTNVILTYVYIHGPCYAYVSVLQDICMLRPTYVCLSVCVCAHLCICARESIHTCMYNGTMMLQFLQLHFTSINLLYVNI
jgi:hypothetical protein